MAARRGNRLSADYCPDEKPGMEHVIKAPLILRGIG